MAKESTQKLSFEQALAKLETLVGEIEGGQVSLEESIAKYGEGTKLISQCRSILDKAEKKIQILSCSEGDQLKPDGELDNPAGT